MVNKKDVSQEEKKEETQPEAKKRVEDKDKKSSFPGLDKAEEIVKRTEEAADRIEKANAATAELIARQALSGKTEAGVEPPKEEEVSPVDYAKDAISGKLNEQNFAKV